MAYVYWFADALGEGVALGNGTAVGTHIVRWIRNNGKAALIVYGGDVYYTGSQADFDMMYAQLDGNVTLMCAPPGNHEYEGDPTMAPALRTAVNYEQFWLAHPESAQPIDATKVLGARNEHFIDLCGWRLIFLDTGDYEYMAWPAGDMTRVTWLKSVLLQGRRNIVFAHHSRLSRGILGDNDRLDLLWRTLFDIDGRPRVACTIAGHEHNLSVYNPRGRDSTTATSPTKGIYLIVNGAGGDGLCVLNDPANVPSIVGTMPDRFRDDTSYYMTRINLQSSTKAIIDQLAVGLDGMATPTAKSHARVTLSV